MSVKDEYDRALAAGREHYFDVGYREGVLNGEWAGESMGELSMQWGVDLSDPDLAAQFEEGFYAEQAQDRNDEGFDDAECGDA